MPYTRFIMTAMAAALMCAAPAFAEDPAKEATTKTSMGEHAHKPMMHKPMDWDKLPPDVQKDMPKDKWQAMKPEERHDWMKQRRMAMRDKWEKMNPEERAKFEKEHPRFSEHMKRREARHEKWEKMTPEEREKAKAEMKERHEKHKAHGEGHKPGDAAPSAGQ